MGELSALEQALQSPARPLVAIVAGSKVSTKLTVLESLLSKVDRLIVGGGIANTFLAATGVAIGKSLYEADMLDTARRLLVLAKARGTEIPLPVDVVVATQFAATPKRRCAPSVMYVRMNSSWTSVRRTAKSLAAQLHSAGTILWNGPVGVFEFEQFGEGTGRWPGPSPTARPFL